MPAKGQRKRFCSSRKIQHHVGADPPAAVPRGLTAASQQTTQDDAQAYVGDGSCPGRAFLLAAVSPVTDVVEISARRKLRTPPDVGNRPRTRGRSYMFVDCCQFNGAELMADETGVDNGNSLGI